MATKNQKAGQTETIEDRRLKVFALRKAGASYRQIAVQQGVSYQTVAKDVRAVLGKLAAEQLAEAESYRALELERLDALQVAIWPRAVGALGVPPDLAAIDRVIRISEARRKLLGIDTPVTQVTEQNGTLQIEMIEVSVSALAVSQDDLID